MKKLMFILMTIALVACGGGENAEGDKKAEKGDFSKVKVGMTDKEVKETMGDAMNTGEVLGNDQGVSWMMYSEEEFVIMHDGKVKAIAKSQDELKKKSSEIVNELARQ